MILKRYEWYSEALDRWLRREIFASSTSCKAFHEDKKIALTQVVTIALQSHRGFLFHSPVPIALLVIQPQSVTACFLIRKCLVCEL